eukprot:2317617-Rhodomonas_salina.1
MQRTHRKEERQELRRRTRSREEAVRVAKHQGRNSQEFLARSWESGSRFASSQERIALAWSCNGVSPWAVP